MRSVDLSPMKTWMSAGVLVAVIVTTAGCDTPPAPETDTSGLAAAVVAGWQQSLAAHDASGVSALCEAARAGGEIPADVLVPPSSPSMVASVSQLTSADRHQVAATVVVQVC